MSVSVSVSVSMCVSVCLCLRRCLSVYRGSQKKRCGRKTKLWREKVGKTRRNGLFLVFRHINQVADTESE